MTNSGFFNAFENFGSGGIAPVAAQSGASLTTYDSPMDGSDWTDLGGTGGDITGDFDTGKQGVTGDPVHGVMTQRTPESGKFTFRWVVTHAVATSAHYIANLALLNNQNARRLGSYASSGGNPNAGDQSICIAYNGGKLTSSGLTGALIELQAQDGSTYTVKASYAGTANAGTRTHTIDVHVDLNGGNPNVSVDLDSTEVIAATSMGAGGASYGSYVSQYTEGSGGGTSALAGNTVDEHSWDENA